MIYLIILIFVLGFFRNRKKLIYTFKHKRAYLQVEKALLGRITIKGLVHDLDKALLLLVGIPPKTASKIHRRWSAHHEQEGIIRDTQSAIIDWECARITKPDKPLNAWDTWRKYYSHVPGVYRKMVELGLSPTSPASSGRCRSAPPGPNEDCLLGSAQ